jgi:hypothetical protein
VDNELERIWEKNNLGLIKIPSWHFLEALKETKEPHGIAGVPSEISTEHLPNTSL